MTSNSETYLSPVAVARTYPGVRVRDLATWRSGTDRAGPPYVKVGHRAYYPASMLAAWAATRGMHSPA